MTTERPVLDEQMEQECMESIFQEAIINMDARTVKDLLIIHRKAIARLDIDKGLCEGVKQGDVTIISLLLEARPSPDLRYTDQKGRRALHYAALMGPKDAVQLLIKYGAAVNWADEEGYYPLHLAALNGHSDIIEHLIFRGAHVNTSKTYKDGETALHVAAGAGHMEAVRTLILCGASVNVKTPRQKGSYSPLHKPSQNGHLEVVNLLIEHGAHVNDTNSVNRQSIHLACDAGELEIVVALVEAGAEIEVKDEKGRTPLQCAVGRGHTPIVKYLVDYGADVNSADRTGYTPLHNAVLIRSFRIVQLLLENGADVSAREFTRRETPLLLAASLGDAVNVQQIILRGGDANAQDLDGSAALHRAQSIRHRKEHRDLILQFLIKGGARLNIEDSQGYTPLHNSVFQGVLNNFSISTVKILVRAGAHLRPNTLARHRNSPLCWLVWHGLLDAADYLVRAGWDIRGETWINLPGKSVEHNEFHERLLEMLRYPRSMNELCRSTIRDHLLLCTEDREILSGISELPLPNRLKDFLMLYDCEDDNDDEE